MIDTVTLTCAVQLEWSLLVTARIEEKPSAPSTHPWKFSGRGFDKYDGTIGHSVRAFNPDTGVTVVGNRDGARKIEGSLPRILFGDNIRPLNSDAELTAALDKMFSSAADIVKVRGLPRDLFHFSRIDLCLGIPYKPQLLISLHRELRLNAVSKKLPINHPGESLIWGGKKSVRRLTFYDKLRQMGVPIDDGRTRIELRLLGKGVASGFGLSPKETLREIDLCQAYRALRNHLLKFPQQTFAAKYSQDLLVAWCMDRRLPGPDGREVLAWRLDGRKPDTARKIRNKVTSALPRLAQFRWSEVLPEDPRGKFVDVPALLGGKFDFPLVRM